LAEKGLIPVWIEDDADPAPGTADIYLVLYPGTFGFRIVDSTSLMMASFVEFEAVYSSKPITDKNRPAKDRFYITDKSQVTYNQLLEDTAGINPRIESVLKAAARRLTNKIVYNTK
jgi:hypothetical protein